LNLFILFVCDRLIFLILLYNCLSEMMTRTPNMDHIVCLSVILEIKKNADTVNPV